MTKTGQKSIRNGLLFKWKTNLLFYRELFTSPATFGSGAHPPSLVRVGGEVKCLFSEDWLAGTGRLGGSTDSPYW